MEIKVLEEDKDMMKVELVGEGHTLANAVKEELCEDEKVRSSVYVVEHPLKSNPVLIFRTKKGRTPKAALKGATQRLQKKASEFKTKYKKAK